MVQVMVAELVVIFEVLILEITTELDPGVEVGVGDGEEVQLDIGV